MKLKPENKIKKGSVLALVIVSIILLIILGIGILSIGYGARLNAIRIAQRSAARMAAEAGYEKAVFWLSQQDDVANVIISGGGVPSASFNLDNTTCNYNVSFFSFLGSRPAYKITSTGSCGMIDKTIEVIVIQEIGGWDMGICRVPIGSSTTGEVNFASGEIIDMPLHVNRYDDSPDVRDIYISGSPTFLSEVSMAESRYTTAGSDKYAGVMNLFDGGIKFDQPNSKITDETAVQAKIDRFRDTTKAAAKFYPRADAGLSNSLPAVQLEFAVINGVGKVRVTNNCTVRGYQRYYYYDTYDYMIVPGSNGQTYMPYYIYSYHVIDEGESRPVYNITDSYVTQQMGGVSSPPGGQIFVDGNVIIGGDLNYHDGKQVIKGNLTIVATGNIWIADSILLDGPHDASGMPADNNTNALGLIAQGVVKVVDPGMSDYNYVDNKPVEPSGYEYVPIGIDDPYTGKQHARMLPNSVEIEAAITVGGGGFGAENVMRNYQGGRKEYSGYQDYLVLRGTLTEAVRGVVGLVGTDGFVKRYYFDERILKGILPGDMWLRGKFSPAPAGWIEY
jgi:type II secretory pathway pseudopilin PulG